METHGDCNVPQSRGSLSTWTSTQRTNYRLLKEGKSSPMSDDRIRKLESIGFQWITTVGKERVRALWHDRFQALQKYMETHGDYNVPQSRGSLGSWVSNQRTHYRLLKEGKTSPMTDDRICKLESIGFQLNSALANKERHDLWHNRFQELKKYIEMHGDCNVPCRHEHLGSWVSNQRTCYRLLKEGKTSPMSDDRIRKLESIGFCWSRKQRRDSGGTYQHTTNDAPADSNIGTYMLLS